jgi:hypothetical protein
VHPITLMPHARLGGVPYNSNAQTGRLLIETSHGLNRLWKCRVRRATRAMLEQIPMKRWIAVVCVGSLTGCAGPQISVTDASRHRVGFLVQNAWMVPMQDVDEQAASYCGQHGLPYRRTDAAWVGPTLKRVAYECGWVDQPQTRKLGDRRSTATKPDPKAAAWTKAKAATDAWALCLRFDAERKANETTEPPRSVAQQIVDACSGLERAVHEPLEAVGEDSSPFEADLHAQAMQNASDAVESARMKPSVKPGVPISGPSEF